MKLKRTILALLAALAVCLCAAGCGTGENGPDHTGAENTSPAETPSTPAETPADPVEYDFSGLVLDEYTKTLTGFEGLPWGYVLPQELVDDLGGDEMIVLLSTTQFAGLEFHAQQVFHYTSSIPELTEDQRALTMGQYVQEGRFSLDDPEGSTASAVADFNQVLAYLTEVYGAPASCTLNNEALSGTLTAAQFGSDGTGDCLAIWNQLDGATISLRLSGFYGGMITVSFGSTAAPAS